MAAQNISLEKEKADFLARFRGETGHLVYSTSPGGEGRVVSEDEAVHFVTEFTLLADRHARRFGRSVWASVLLLILFSTVGLAYAMPLFVGLGLLAMFGWWYVAIAQRIIRARFKYRVWKAVVHNAPVRALTRHEKIARGFAVSARQWIGIGAALVVYIALNAPPRALPPHWRDLQMLAIGLVIYGSLAALLAYAAFLLVKRLRGRG